MRCTLRPATTSEIDRGFPRHVVVNPDTGNLLTVFGLAEGGDTPEEAVYWAERMASKNGLDYVAPAGWESVEGAPGVSATHPDDLCYQCGHTRGMHQEPTRILRACSAPGPTACHCKGFVLDALESGLAEAARRRSSVEASWSTEERVLAWLWDTRKTAGPLWWCLDGEVKKRFRALALEAVAAAVDDALRRDG